jgi:hypothetical protein
MEAASTFFAPGFFTHGAAVAAAVIGGAIALYHMTQTQSDGERSADGSSYKSPVSREYESRADTPLGRAMVGRTFRLHGVALEKLYVNSEQYELVDHSEFIAERQLKPLPRTNGIATGHLRRGDLLVDDTSKQVHIPLPEGIPVEVTDVRTLRGAVGWPHIWVVGRLKRLPRFLSVQKVRMSDVTHASAHASELTKSGGVRPHIFDNAGLAEVVLRDPGEVIISAKVAGVERADADGQREPLERGFIETEWMVADARIPSWPKKR